MKKYIIIILLGLISIEAANAFDIKYNRKQYGIYGDAIFIDQKMNFSHLPGYVSCAPNFINGSGNGFEIGCLFEYPISKLLFVSARAGFEKYHTTAKADESFEYIYGNETYKGLIQHKLEAKWSNIPMEITLGLRPVEGLILSTGFHFALPLSPTFSQKEILQQPQDFGTFENGLRERNVIKDADIPNYIKPIVNCLFRLSYEFPLTRSGSLRFAPEISLNLPLTPVLSDYDWHDRSVRAGAAIKFAPVKMGHLFLDLAGDSIVYFNYLRSCAGESYKMPSRTAIVYPVLQSNTPIKKWEFTVSARSGQTVYSKSGQGELPKMFEFPAFTELEKQTAKYSSYTMLLKVENKSGQQEEVRKFLQRNYRPVNLFSNLNVYALDENNRRLEDHFKIQVKRRTETSFSPLLNYVFFETNQSNLPIRYIQNTIRDKSEFTENGLKYQDVLTVYHQILDIVGYRMRKFANTSLTLRGCVSALNSELGDTTLALNRARTVQRYLTNLWHIDESRIEIVVDTAHQCLPDSPSMPGEENHYVESAEENQRVEIIPNVGSEVLLEPVIIVDSAVSIQPKQIVLKPEVNTTGQNVQWSYSFEQKDNILYTKMGAGIPDSQIVDITELKDKIKSNAGNPVYKFAITDEYGQNCSDTGEIAINNIEIDSLINKYILILFDYESFRLGSANLETLDRVKRAIDDNSRVEITGYTDALGDSKRNMLLSKKRAYNTSVQLFNLGADENPEGLLKVASPAVLENRLYRMGDADINKTNVIFSVYGIGEHDLLYPNDTPEGRFYCRTVTITVAKAKNSGLINK